MTLLSFYCAVAPATWQAELLVARMGRGGLGADAGHRGRTIDRRPASTADRPPPPGIAILEVSAKGTRTMSPTEALASEVFRIYFVLIAAILVVAGAVLAVLAMGAPARCWACLESLSGLARHSAAAAAALFFSAAQRRSSSSPWSAFSASRNTPARRGCIATGR